MSICRIWWDDSTTVGSSPGNDKMLDEGKNWSPEPSCIKKGTSWVNFNEAKKKKKVKKMKKIVKIKKIRLVENRDIC